MLYLNCGDWVDSCTAIVEHPGGRLKLVEWRSDSPRASIPQSVRHLDWERIHDGYADLLRDVADRHTAEAFAASQIYFAPD